MTNHDTEHPKRGDKRSLHNTCVSSREKECLSVTHLLKPTNACWKISERENPKARRLSCWETTTHSTKSKHHIHTCQGANDLSWGVTPPVESKSSPASSQDTMRLKSTGQFPICTVPCFKNKCLCKNNYIKAYSDDMYLQIGTTSNM